LGLQLMLDDGDEGIKDGKKPAGLGLIAGHCPRLANHDNQDKAYKVPHVGWNQVHYRFDTLADKRAAVLFDGLPDGSNFYFTHSYQAKPDDDGTVIATTTHAEEFPVALIAGNAVGVQFHPEKSSQRGMRFLENFVRFAQMSQ
jgi:glutamine amidotransferase